MKVGFTGTRHGMTKAQKETVLRLLRNILPTEVHHGCCVGADADVHSLAYWDWPLHGHPGPDGPLRAKLDDFYKLYPAKSYGERNQDIVDACDVLVAAPVDTEEARSGGTWQTVRRARKARKRVIIVWPDGSTT